MAEFLDTRDPFFRRLAPAGGSTAALAMRAGGVSMRRPSPVVLRWFAALVALAAVIAVVTLTLAPGRQAVPPTPATAREAAAPPPVEEQRLLEVPPETARALNAERPIVAGPLPPARPFRFAGTPEAAEHAIDCLAAASWYEASDEPVGQRAVIQVVLNRVRHPAFPSSVCGVVLQGAERATGCQFTFTCDGSLTRRRPSDAAWARARALARAALAGAVDRNVGYATHYHADYVVPYWASSQDKIAQVGPHLFYLWRGFWGTRAAFSRLPAKEEPQVAALAFLSPAHMIDGTPLTGFPAQLPAGVAPIEDAPPPPILVEGVREKSLRGALVRGAEADAGRYFLQLDGGVFPGNYATAAVALCKGKPSCSVFGWTDASRMGHALPLSEPQRQALSFQFVKNGEADNKALWNCGQFPRSNKAQCLPTAGPAAPTAGGPSRAAQ